MGYKFKTGDKVVWKYGGCGTIISVRKKGRYGAYMIQFDNEKRELPGRVLLAKEVEL